MGTVCCLPLQRSGACWRPGGLELLLGHWRAALASSLHGDSRNPLTREGEAAPAPLILDAFCLHKSPADATGKGPSKGGAHYHGKFFSRSR